VSTKAMRRMIISNGIRSLIRVITREVEQFLTPR
jgi:hypothetical protein